LPSHFLVGIAVSIAKRHSVLANAVAAVVAIVDAVVIVGVSFVEVERSR
jgi:hypothetical protein